MSKYIIINTFCDKEEIATKIIQTLLEKRLVSGSQLSKVHSKYWWNNQLEECDEFKLQFRTKKELFKEVEKEIKRIHDYDVAEISAIDIENGSEEFFSWIEGNVKDDRC